jgi:predicted nucleic acid-binding protein
VVDASVALSWCLPDEPKTTWVVLEEIGKDGAVVPAIWPFEVSNSLLVAERRKRISSIQANKALTMLFDLPIEIQVPLSISETHHLVSLARNCHLSVYDASYLQLALEWAIPLASLDDDLCRAAKQNGVELAF